MRGKTIGIFRLTVFFLEAECHTGGAGARGKMAVPPLRLIYPTTRRSRCNSTTHHDCWLVSTSENTQAGAGPTGALLPPFDTRLLVILGCWTGAQCGTTDAIVMGQLLNPHATESQEALLPAAASSGGGAPTTPKEEPSSC
jgi:hypothetical protein